ncbi:MAG: NADH:ubiquinone reductase (Na(+)-transporting) subunit C [Spirochaetaceae bacterium]|nr:NADH:ubiquinone reductase (Na(+)-transporting) subunit C [Spirochaetaceae bacterium]
MQHSKPYTIGFILIITALFGLLLALAASALSERQQFNEEVNVKRNILMAVGVLDRDREMELDEIDAMYQESVQSFAVDPEGTIVEGVSGESLDLEVVLQNPDTSQHHYPVFVATDAGGSTVYAIPVFGKGLWSTLYGYLALEADLETVRGMTFYAHGETPGLGAEIEQAWFQDNFVGKKIYDAGALRTIQVVKGTVENRIQDPGERDYFVDGISGATITGRGVSNLLETKVALYEPFFRRIRAGG